MSGRTLSFFVTSSINLDVLIVCLILSSIVLIFVLKMDRHKLILVGALGFILLALSPLVAFIMFRDLGIQEVEVDDSDIVLVIEQESFLLGGWARVYIKTNSLVYRETSVELSGDDGFKPHVVYAEFISPSEIRIVYENGNGTSETTFVL